MECIKALQEAARDCLLHYSKRDNKEPFPAELAFDLAQGVLDLLDQRIPDIFRVKESEQARQPCARIEVETKKDENFPL